jgi:galactokinase
VKASLISNTRQQISKQNHDSAIMEVPTKTSLADIYPGDALEAQTKRWNSLLSTFKDTYGKSADFVSRSPGRVNIIGEVSELSALSFLKYRY